jgi:hypothetical protein
MSFFIFVFLTILYLDVTFGFMVTQYAHSEYSIQFDLWVFACLLHIVYHFRFNHYYYHIMTKGEVVILCTHQRHRRHLDVHFARSWAVDYHK